MHGIGSRGASFFPREGAGRARLSPTPQSGRTAEAPSRAARSVLHVFGHLLGCTSTAADRQRLQIRWVVEARLERTTDALNLDVAGTRVGPAHQLWDSCRPPREQSDNQELSPLGKSGPLRCRSERSLQFSNALFEITMAPSQRVRLTWARCSLRSNSPSRRRCSSATFRSLLSLYPTSTPCPCSPSPTPGEVAPNPGPTLRGPRARDRKPVQRAARAPTRRRAAAELSYGGSSKQGFSRSAGRSRLGLNQDGLPFRGSARSIPEPAPASEATSRAREKIRLMLCRLRTSRCAPPAATPAARSTT